MFSKCASRCTFSWKLLCASLAAGLLGSASRHESYSVARRLADAFRIALRLDLWLPRSFCSRGRGSGAAAAPLSSSVREAPLSQFSSFAAVLVLQVFRLLGRRSSLSRTASERASVNVVDSMLEFERRSFTSSPWAALA